ncbi:replication-relaxation family protein [uncultured Microbacterium sp.]|uniref:replication-relaxation family protein n=1 Tax=uncultured Microbacterium sp. TaxID=191216 RepID=UPI00263021AE|nr:replication-relaxation family protein [uncultured Microbacterium sp.]
MTALRLDTLDLYLTDRDVRILEDLEQYRLLTTRQIQRLHLPAKPFGEHATVSAATRGTTRILTRLETLGAIARLERRIGGSKHGSAVTTWQLGGAGERYLRARRGDSTRRRYSEPSPTFVDHTLATADVAVALREHSHLNGYDVLHIQAEPACWRPFTGPTGAAITLKPDLAIATADQFTETHSLVEVDLATEHLPVIIRKCRLYQQYFQTGIEQNALGLFPAVVWLVPAPKRATAIQKAIHADPSLDPDLFWITLLDQAVPQLAPYSSEHTT